MPMLWIIHRDPRRRAAIARLAAAPESAILAAPGDPLLDSATPAEVVLLGLAGDLEAELEFAHRAASRLRGARWILLPEAGDLEAARRLFDTVDAAVLGYPPDARELRRRIAAAPAAEPLPLSRRRPRDALRERFARWLGDLELPELLRALDPRLADAALLIRGEPGTGRELLARYVHHFGGTAGGLLVPVGCAPGLSAGSICGSIAAATRERRAPCTVLLEGVDRLPADAQRRLRSWIEFGLPEHLAHAPVARWIGTAGTDEALLDPDLRRALSGLGIHLPPLRERTGAIAGVVQETARAWCAAREERPRRFDETAILALEEYPWPGNLRELEAVVVQTLSAATGDPIPAGDLQLDGRPFAPLNAADVGALLSDEESAAAAGESELLVETFAELTAPTGMPIEVIGRAEADSEESESRAGADPALRRLAGAVAHEVRGPLSSIRTFAALLPERFRDGEFREQFAALVGRDVLRIEDVIERLARLASLEAPKRGSVDVPALLETLLDERRDAIRERRLLVLKELDASQPCAVGDADQLRFAFEALLSKSLELVPDRGDVYFASRHHAAGLRGEPSVRVLVRFHGPERETAVAPPEGAGASENALEFAIAEALIRAQGGSFALDATDGGETVIVVDLPAPP